MPLDAEKRSGLSPDIIINIDNSADACGVEKAEEIIQRDAMLGFFRDVSDSIKKAREYRQFLMRGEMRHRKREHDTITVSGGRGAGKTTFILSMFNLLEKQDELKLIPTAEGISPFDIEILGILDPTLIEEKEHVFIHLLSMIKQKVDNAYRVGVDHLDDGKRRHDDCYCDSHIFQYATTGLCDFRPISDECYRDWLKLLKCLAAGLPSLDGIGGASAHNSEKWHDPIYVMEKGLRNTAASNDLEINFHRFVDMSLRLLNRTAFIVALDDIDTHFNRGWRVLEVLRQYLTTPQLITVLSGDLDLYSLLIRGRQWKNFEKELLEHEKERHSHFQREVDKLEQQYLLKLMKSERRLELRSLYYLVEERVIGGSLPSKCKRILVTSDGDNSPADIGTVLDDLVNNLFMVVGADKNLYRGHFIREVIRTVIRIITVFERSRLQSGRVDDSSIRNSLLDVLLDVYSVPLQQKGFDVHFLRDPDPRIALNQVVVGLADNGLLESGYRLKADFLDAEQNQLMMSLGAVYNNLFQHNPRLFFDYFVKIGLTREISILSESNEKQETLNRYLTWSGLRNGDNGISVSRQFTGFVRLQTSMLRASTYRGTISLLRPRNKKNSSIIGHIELIQRKFSIALAGAKPFETFKTRLGEKHPLGGFIAAIDPIQQMARYEKVERTYFFNSAEELETLITSWHWRLVNLGLNRVVGSANDSMTYWSFHTLLAVIGEVAECDDQDQIRYTLLRSSQIRDFPLPRFAIGTLDKIRFETMEGSDSDDESDQRIPDQFLMRLEKWNEYQKYALPVHVVGKIFARFFYSLGRIDSDLAISERYFGDIIHRYIVIFLNSVLVEEAIYKSKQVNLNNPTGGDKVFITNLKKISNYLNEFKFFSYIASCPLWGYFLDLSSPAAPLLNDCFNGINVSDKVKYLGEVDFDNLHDLLNASLVRSVKDEENEDEESVKSGTVSDKPNKKPRYNLPELDKLLKKEGNEIRSFLENFDSDSFEMTKNFIEKYLRPCYVRVPTTTEGRQFNSIRRKLEDFLKNK